MISVELTNRAEIVKLLDQIPNAYNSKAVRSLIKHSVKPLVEEAQRLAPKALKPHKGKYGMVQPGNLARSIWTIDMKRSRTVTLIVGPRVKGAFRKNRSGFYGMWLERGTKKIKAQPFMRPAWDSKKGEVIRRFEEDAIKIFEKVIRKLTKKGLI
jgi:HK97 gp10 family phage protein